MGDKTPQEILASRETGCLLRKRPRTEDRVDDQ
jgi:hypothetical protein